MDKLFSSILVALLIGGVVGYNIRGNTASQKPQSSDNMPTGNQSQKSAEELKVQSALSAAPESIAKDATVMDFPAKEGGDLIELKKGTNEWTCIPDFPNSPGKDPMCVDKQGMEWMQAYMTQSEPNLAQPGIGYMLVGGSDASNTDPFATKPTKGDDWITTPSHLMIFPATGGLDPTIYGTDPKSGGPWIMWAGTPYEHLMVPVK